MNLTQRQALWTFVALLVGGLVVSVVTATVVSAVKSTSIQQNTNENTSLLQNTDETLKIIRGCTTPGEDCYDRGQRSTAAIVADLTNDLTRVTAYAAACADQSGVQGEEEILACVVSRLARDRR